MSKSPIADKAIPAGLKVWLIFLISFYLLGLPVILSILFGFMGGVAGGWIFAWWQTAGGEPLETRSTEETEQTNRRASQSRFRVPFFRKSLTRRNRRSPRIRR